MRRRIEAALEGWSIPYSEGQLERLVRYREVLEEWNRKVGLVARGEDLTDHILDSLRGLPLLETLTGSLIADAGSGGGLPGIPLAVFQPRRRFVLVERSAKKAGFLRYAAAAAGLDNVEVAGRGLEELETIFDGVVFRALGELGRYFDLLLRVTLPGGWLLGYKGRFDTALAEMDGLDMKGVSTDLIPAPPVPGPGTNPGSSGDAGGASGTGEKERSFLIVRKV